MRTFKYIWIFGLIFTGLIIILPIALLVTDAEEPQSDPRENVEEDRPHTDHANLLQGPFETGRDVTRACLECHPDAG
ncbi:MAG: hypothetical protein L0154_18675, partial [Chloroflexi bacterium]|nr:hypothetical protein [Chloroflexota bacterium]